MAALRRVLWAAVYGKQHVPARRDRRHRRDMRCRSLNQAARARFRTTSRRHSFPRLDRAERTSTILHAPRRAQRCPIERALHPARSACGGGLAHHASDPCRVLECADGGVICAAEVCGEMVLSWDEGQGCYKCLARRFFPQRQSCLCLIK